MKDNENKFLMDHVYDGIEEFNFPLPNWWLATFWIGIIFGVGYIGYYIFMNGPSLKHEYFVERAEMSQIRRNYIESIQEFDEGRFAQMAGDQNMVLYGQAVFESNCMPCHQKNAAGDIGPNLTDNYWLYTDGSNEGLYQFILGGAPSAGMPAWAGDLSQDELYSVSAYIASLKGIEHVNPKAKAPQGELYE